MPSIQDNFFEALWMVPLFALTNLDYALVFRLLLLTDVTLGRIDNLLGGYVHI